MKKLILLSTPIIYLFFLSACTKPVVSEGRVFSKSGKIVPDVTVSLSLYTSGKDAPLGNPFQTTTDANGHFMFSERVNKNLSVGLGCEANGEFFHVTHLSREDIKHYDIHLK